MSDISTLRENKRPWWLAPLLVLGVWTIVALLTATDLYFKTQASDQPVDWLTLVAIQIMAWYIWALYTPLILWFGRKVRIERRSWLWAFPLHLVASILLPLLFLLIYVFIFQYQLGIPISGESVKNFYFSFFFDLFHWEFLMYWAILGMGYAFEYYQKFREREVFAVQLESKLNQARLDALKMQLQPHFLFNTLHTIGSMVRLSEKEKALEMLAGLSDLLRLALSRDERQEVSLEEELELLEQYLAIESVRFQDNLKVQIECPAELRSALVPNLLLQPLVENAIRHGIAKRIGAGRLEIKVEKKEDRLEIDVFNEGPTLEETKEKRETGGIGLENTRSRLQQLYGDDQSFEIGNHENGVLVHINYPFRRKAGEVS